MASGINGTRWPKSPVEQLRLYLDARRPIIYIRDFDFAMVDRLILEAAGDGYKIEEFATGSGVVDFRTKSPVDKHSGESLADFLSAYNDDFFNTDPKRHLLVLKEVHERQGDTQGSAGTLADRQIVGILQSIAQRVKKADEDAAHENLYDVTVVIVDSELAIPRELEKWTTMVDVPLPDETRIREIVADFKKANAATIADSYLPQLTMDLKGLSEFEIRQLLNIAVVMDGEVSRKNRDIILREKRQTIKKSGLLETVDVDENEEVGGLETLQRFFDGVKPVFDNPALAERHGVKMPTGVMIVGMPGCGKSLSAKCVAKKLAVPLIKLDVGRLMGKYVGESEGNLARAIRMAESASPCILWIDEIEKAFAGIGGSGGGGEVTTRMFGAFLTWMQEKKTCVYVVATANDISNLPPEFLRRGRFDEIFQVRFPNKEERAKIFEVHLKKKNGGSLPQGVNPAALAAMLPDKENYSGADIESIVVDAMKRLFSRNFAEFTPERESEWKPLTQTDIEDVVRETASSFHSQEEKLKPMLAKLDKLDVKSAS